MAITRIADSDDDDGNAQSSDNRPRRARFIFSGDKGKGRAPAATSNGSSTMMIDDDVADDGGGDEEEDEDDYYEDDNDDDDDDDGGGAGSRGGPSSGSRPGRVTRAGGKGAAGGKASASGSGSGSRTKLAWEEEYSRSWDALTEDVHGSLEGAVAAFLTSAKRRRIIRDTAAIQRGIIRHLFLVLDLSESMLDRDMRPSRLDLTLRYTMEFVSEYFDQNPISQLAIIATQNGMATRISSLGGNPVEHLKKIQDLISKKKDAVSGEPSLQNALNMARSGLAHLPSHGSREVVVVFGSLTTCDPGNIHDTIDALVKDRVRCNIIGLSAEMSVCREICKKTRGTYTVCLNEDHFKDLLFENILPPAALKPSALSIAKGDTTASRNTNVNAADLMIMGFPTLQKQSQHPTLCACHSKLYKSKGYICPRCSSKLCEVPTECVVCRLTIVSSPHLARSYRHLFPVSNWKEVNGLNGSDEMPSHCFGCNVKFPPFAEATGAPPTARSEGVTSRTSQTITGEITASTSVTGNISPTGRYQCPKCTRMFCIDCDIFVHQLGACPGCQ